MKRIIILLLTLLMTFTLVGCNSNDKQEEQPISKEDTPIAEIEVTEEDIKEDTPIVGGWTDAEDSTITDELKDIFNEALKGLLGASYEPKELIATQVVNGINYKFLAEGKKTTNPITKGTYYVTVNKSATGEISLVDIETIEEKQEEVKKSTIDYTKLDYWVVFYDQFGNELQREALRYGSVPTYHSDIPYFDDGKYWYKGVGWSDKEGNTISEFKPITGNTKFYAIYEECGEVVHTVATPAPEPAPEPAPAPSHVCQYSTAYLVYCNSWGSEANIDVYEYFEGDYYYLSNIPNLLVTYYSGDLSAGRWSHTDMNPNSPTGTIPFTYCEDYEAHTIDPCFIAGTQVQYDLLGHTKSIENYKIGDQIVSYNVNTNKYYLAKVGKVFVHDGKDKVNILADVILEDGSIITMTPNHPVYTTVGFRAIENDHRPKLMEGQFVMTANGWTQIKEIKTYDCEQTVTYNLNVIDYDEIKDDDTNDTYIAGGIVVHNIK